MQTYIVGGAVRDRLLGLPVKDRDWVVVGATADEMIATGYKPVGKDFPVFLHPETHEEYALARTERKNGHGYHGFVFHAAPDVTLEQDLARRDLTINAIAEDEQGNLIDPYHGLADLQAGIIRHVSPAFAEDPVRILRLARFAARFGFSIAPETLALCRDMVLAGEVDHLVAERVWQEFAKGLMSDQPSRMFDALRQSGALERLWPELNTLWGVPQPAQWHPEIDAGVHVMMVLDCAAKAGANLAVRFAALCHDLGKGTTPPEEWPRHIAHEARSVKLTEAVCERLRVPTDVRDLAILCAREHGVIHKARELRDKTMLDLLIRCDALRRPERFELLLQACLADARGRTGFESVAYPQADYLRACLAAAQAVNAGAIAAACNDKSQIAKAVFRARIEAISHVDFNRDTDE